MELLLTLLVAAIVGIIVYVVLTATVPRYADIGGLVAFLITLLIRLGA